MDAVYKSIMSHSGTILNHVDVSEHRFDSLTPVDLKKGQFATQDLWSRT